MTPGMLFVLAMAEKVFAYGIPEAIKLLNQWNVENPTVADIQALGELKPPESYFEDTPTGDGS